MFGLTVKERLFNIIYSTCQKNIDKYKIGIYEYCKKYENCDPPEEGILELRKAYLDSVLDDVFNLVGNSSSKVLCRLRLVLMSPDLSGYPDSDFENGVSAGFVYACCYWAIKNRQANISDCFALNHLQTHIMDEALNSLSGAF